MNRSVVIAIGIAAALALYFAVGTMLAADRSSDANSAEQKEAEPERPIVIVTTMEAQSHPITVEFKGQTAPDKVVTVKSGTMGTVVSTPAREGAFVNKGDLLCGLDVEARRANVQQAEAQRAAAVVDYEAAVALAKKGLTPANREAAAKAALDAATAAVSAAKIELSKTQIRAPFAGIFETRLAEAGDFLNPGGPCGVLVDLSPVLVTAQISEEQAAFIKPGLTATATLTSEQQFPATVSYVARTANVRTRTFAIEAELQTGEARVAAGITTRLRVPLASVDAILLSPALLTLADNGDVGVRYVDDGDVVRFSEVTIVDNSENGVWVSGLPRKVRIISAGQEFLSEGLKVEPYDAESAPS